MFNHMHMCLVITTAILAAFIADFLTPVKRKITMKTVCTTQNWRNFMHAIADACMYKLGGGVSRDFD